MAKHGPDAGALLERIKVLRLERSGNAWSWRTLRESWASAEWAGRRNNFSVHGVGAPGAKFLIRRQDITLADAIEWRGQSIFLSNIQEHGRLHLDVEGAWVDFVGCEYLYGDGLTFPAVMTEKYLWHREGEPMDLNTLWHVLVTPKDVVLKPGRQVRVAGVDWPILVAHTLDKWHNEYEIERTVDL